MKPIAQKTQPPQPHTHNTPNTLKQQDGFSGDEQQQQQFLYSMPQNIDQYLDEAYTHTKLKLQPIHDIIKKSYSLQPDMINGWIPKIMLAKPIPLKFNNYGFDQMIQYAIKTKIIDKGYSRGQQKDGQVQKQQKIQLCYMGPRYQTTYYAWYDKQIQFPYKHLNAPKNIKITDRFLVGQHWNAQKQNILYFDSIIQSGNLDCAFKVGQNQYDLFIRVDSNTKGHLQWYNFKIKNIIPRKIYKINICNFQKGKSLYTRGMRPYCYSLKKHQNQQIQWHQIKGQVKYRKKICKTYKKLQLEQNNKLLALTFEFSTQYQNDIIQFAYCIPYTYSYLKKYLNNLSQNNKTRNIVSIKKLCTSLGGHPVDQLTITQNINEQQESYKNKTRIKNKKIIFITGRCHPGQTNGSWMVQGLINFLCGYSDMSIMLRQNIIFKIIPMLNPDGVIIGNYRTGLFGKDFNRQFHYPDKDIFPQIYYLKQMFWAYKAIYQDNAFIYLDFHGHSIKKNVFAYGPQYPINHKNYYQSRLIPKLISLKTHMFRYHSCIFKIAQSKQSTGRAIFLKSHKIPFTFTIQASNGSYFDQEQKENIDFNDQKWKLVGQKVLEVIQLEKIREQKFRQRKQILMRNRQRTKTKKNKNSRLGYSTSMGFRKNKTFQDQENYDSEKQKLNINKISFSFNDMLGGMKNMLDGQKFSSILEQIKNQQNKSEIEENNKKQSQDQISQGKSDSQGEEDDLDQGQRNQLMHMIKQNRYKIKVKSKNTSRLSKKPKQVQPNLQIKTMYDVGHGQNQEGQEERQQKVEKQNSKKSTKDIMMKKYFWKKKNSAFSSVSPKKQDQMAAKIVNFNFSLNPMQCTISNKNQTIPNPSPGNPTVSASGYQTHNSAYCTTYYTLKSSNAYLTNITVNDKQQKILKINQHQHLQHPQQKKFGARVIEYSDTFKKTFMSVQKQMLRRDSYKRYLVSVNNQNKTNNKPGGGVGIDNIKGKKIGSTQQQQEMAAQEIQLMKQQRYIQGDRLEEEQQKKYLDSISQTNIKINLHPHPHHPHAYTNSQKRKQIISPPFKTKQKIVNKIHHKNKLKIDVSKSKKQIKHQASGQIQQKAQKQPQKQQMFIEDHNDIQISVKMNNYEQESNSPLTLDSPIKRNLANLDLDDNQLKCSQSLPNIQ